MRRFRHVPLVLAVSLVAVAALLSSSAMAWLRVQLRWFSGFLNWVEQLWPGVDSTHVLMFVGVGAVLAFLGERRRSWAVLWVPLARVAVLACLSELVQFWVPGRTPLLSDVRDDLIGGVVGIALVLTLREAWHLLKRAIPA